MEKNAILFSRVDREDGWVCDGICFKVNNTKTYEDAYIEIKDKLESPEVTDYVLGLIYLAEDDFDDDTMNLFKFNRTSWSHGLYFYFLNEENGDELEYKFSADLVTVFN